MLYPTKRRARINAIYESITYTEISTKVSDHWGGENTEPNPTREIGQGSETGGERR